MQNTLQWFKVNSMKTNPKKFLFMILDKSNTQSIITNVMKLRKSSNAVLLGLTNHNRLTFKDHISILYLRASFKFLALKRICKYLTTDMAKLLCNVFINS